MNAVSIDISKGKSTVVVMRPFGEIIVLPFEVTHSVRELSKLAAMLKSLKGETKIIMECTGSYHFLLLMLYVQQDYLFLLFILY